MNQNDKQLIMSLSDKLKQAQSSINKDPEAAELITKEISNQPDAIYLLTQAVLLQEQAIRQLQEQVNELQNQPKKGFFSSFLGGNNNSNYQQQAPQPAGRSAFGQGSFLGSALTTAAGVAGGMFLFEGISHLFSGGSSSAMAGSSMLDNSAMSDPFQGQDQMLNDGFGSGDSFMDDSSGGGMDSGDFGGGFDDGFGGDSF